MAESVSFTRTWIGLGLAAGLLLGCQQFLGQEDKAPAPAGDVTSELPAEMALKLAMKETDECRALHAQVLAADAAGEATVTLQTDFIRNCIEEVRSSDAAGRVVIPADLLPDDRTRCRWLVSEIEGGREELVIKFRYYCPDDCDTLGMADSARHANICRDPKPDCVDLKATLASMDPKSEEYARLRLFLSEHCGARDTLLPPKDTVIVPPSHCDSLRRALAAHDPASEEYARIKRMIAANCPVKPPVDTLAPIHTLCDSLKRRLSTVDTASVEYDRILALLHEKCGRPDTAVVKPPRPDCDSLRRVLAAHPDTASEAFMKARRMLHEYCGEVTPPVDPAPPASQERCDSLRLRLSGLDPASEDYARLKQHWYQECIEPKPINDPVICRHLMSRLDGMDSTAQEYPFLKHEIAHRCPEYLPADPVKPADPVPVSPECEDIRKRMAQTDVSSEEYTRLKTLYSEQCLH